MARPEPNVAAINQPRISQDLVRLCQRIGKLERGKIYLVALTLPDEAEKPITWSFVGSGKEENQGSR